MSLKSFHIFFIAMSSLLGFGVGIWAILYGQAEPAGLYVLFGVFSVLTGFALIYYGVKFLRKSKHLSFM